MSNVLDILLDAHIPKKVKRVNHGTRILHVGDIDTAMKDEEILHLMSKFNSLIITHDRELAIRASKKYRVLYLKHNLSAEEIVACLEKNYHLLNHASLFCPGENCEDCHP